MNDINIFDSILKFAPIEVLQKKSATAIWQLPEQVKYTIPTFEMQGDGPSLKGVFLITDNYITEVRVNEMMEFFDTIKLVVRQILFTREVVDIKISDTMSINFNKTEVTILHSSTGNNTRITFFSDEVFESFKETIFTAFKVGDLVALN